MPPSNERLTVTPERRDRYMQLRETGQVDLLEKELDGTKRDLIALAEMLTKDRILGSDCAHLITEEHGLRTEFLEAHAKPRFDLLDWMGRMIEGKFKDEGAPKRKACVQEVLRKLHTLLFNRVQCLQSKLLEGQVARALSSPEADPFASGALWSENFIRPLFDDFLELMELAEIPPSTDEVIKDFMMDGLCEGKNIDSKLQLDETTFFFVTPHQTPYGHIEILMFVLYRGKVYPRVAYKSKSGTAWRVNFNPGREDGKYDKGPFYTQGNKPVVEVEQVLYAMESRMNKTWPPKAPKMDFHNGDDIFTYPKEISWKNNPTPKGLERVAARGAPDCWGHFDGCIDQQMFNSIPRLFIPDFSRGPLKIKNRQGTIEGQGQVRLELYENNYLGETFQFWMAYDEEGRVWAERGNSGPTELTSYGTQKRVFEWALFSKPFEHTTQLGALRLLAPLEASDLQLPNGSFSERNIAIKVESEWSYADVTPTLDQFNFIQKFREQRGIQRKPIVVRKSNREVRKEVNIEKPVVGGDHVFVEAIHGARQMLGKDHIFITQELEELLLAIGSRETGCVEKKVIEILKNPGSRIEITLRGLRRIIFECHSHFQPGQVEGILEVILEKFTHGFPREKALYTAIYGDLLSLLGVDTPWENQQSSRRLGEPVMTVNQEYLREEPGEPTPKIVRYEKRLQILRAVCRVDEQYGLDSKGTIK